MSRPPDYEWAVLGESEDPIPGDPHQIRLESTRLGKMAQTIRDQTKLLKDIAGDENVGKFAEKLKGAADDLKGDLGKVATRYEEVSGYLGSWAGDLEACQADSIKALTKAQQAAPAAHKPQAHQTPEELQKLTPNALQASIAESKARSAAQGDIDDAKRQLGHIKQHRDDRATHWKQKIEDSDHDSLKDSWWQGVKDFIDQHAGWIKILSDALTWIVTILVVLTFLIPGLDIATWILASLMILALAGHTSLAAAGDGSWMDVAMDVFAIATLGTATLGKAGLEGSVDIADGMARGLRGAGDAEEAGTDIAEAGADASSASEEASTKLSTRVSDAVSNWGKGVGTKFMAGGEKEVVENMEKLSKLQEEFPDNLIIKSAAEHTFFLNQVRVANTAANVADQFGHWAGGSDDINAVGNAFHGHFINPDEGGWSSPNVEGETAPSLGGFMDIKELTTMGIGK